MDLAVTSGTLTIGTVPQGVINTVDVTDPYNPAKIGVVKDSEGQVVNNIFANDITISKASGLVYATTGGAVYVIDIKDPYNPVLLNIITEVPTADGTLVPLGLSPTLVEKDGWVYLANQQKGLRVLDLDPKNIGIEEFDLDEKYKNVLVEKDYYPALGTKIITVFGRINGAPFDPKEQWQLRLNGNIIIHTPAGTQTATNFGDFSIGGKLDNQGNPAPLNPGDKSLLGYFRNEPGYNRSFATIYIRWNGTGFLPAWMNIEMQLQGVKANQTPVVNATATEICKEGACTIAVKHNGNVKFEEALCVNIAETPPLW